MSSLKDLASLIMVPSLYKDGELHTVKPLADENIIVHPDATDNNDGVDGSTPSTSSNFTFSRGSNLAATRVDVNGLIEKGRENLLLQSNNFSNASWIQTDITPTIGELGYDGSNDAWNLNANTTNGNLVQALSFSGVNTLSFYAKQGSLQYVFILFNGGGFNGTAAIDLSDGAIYNTSVYITDIKTTDVGGGWYRIEAVSNRSNSDIRIYPSNNNTGGTTAAGNILIQNAQLEQGLVATDYIETGTSAAQSGILEDMPRLDYSGGASCPSLLLEPQRTNLITQSEFIGSSSWTKTRTTSVANQLISPDGNLNAYKLSETADSGLHAVSINTSVVNGTTYNFSVFAKKGSSSFIQILFGTNNVSGNPYVNFDLDAGTFQNNGVSSVNIENYGNGWYRCSGTIVISGGTTLTYYLAKVNSLSATRASGFAGNVNNNIYIYGFQLEAGSYPTSYIPTYGTSQTRSDDYMQVTPTDLLGSDSGTWFMELNDMTFDIAGTQVPTIYLGDSTSNCLAIEPKSAANNKGLFLVKEESNVSTTLYNFTISGKTKFCFVWSGTTLKVFRDGVQRYSATNFTQPANWDSFVFNHGTREAFSEIPSILLFPTALTDSECIALTTL